MPVGLGCPVMTSQMIPWCCSCSRLSYLLLCEIFPGITDRTNSRVTFIGIDGGVDDDG